MRMLHSAIPKVTKCVAEKMNLYLQMQICNQSFLMSALCIISSMFVQTAVLFRWIFFADLVLQVFFAGYPVW